MPDQRMCPAESRLCLPYFQKRISDLQCLRLCAMLLVDMLSNFGHELPKILAMPLLVESANVGPGAIHYATQLSSRICLLRLSQKGFRDACMWRGLGLVLVCALAFALGLWLGLALAFPLALAFALAFGLCPSCYNCPLAGLASRRDCGKVVGDGRDLLWWRLGSCRNADMRLGCLVLFCVFI